VVLWFCYIFIEVVQAVGLSLVWFSR